MASKIQLRRDTAANWTSVNPTLSQGELGYETDTDKVKIGDGSTAWTGLSYLIDGVTSASIPTLLDQLSDVVITEPANGDSLAYNNGQWVNVVPINTGGGIALTDLSVTEEPIGSGGGSLTYNNTTGTFTFTPAAAAPTSLSELTNDAGFITGSDIASAVTGITDIDSLVAALEGLGI